MFYCRENELGKLKHRYDDNNFEFPIRELSFYML